MAAKASANATHGAHHDDRDLPGIADLQMRVEVAEDKGKLYIPILDSQEAVEVVLANLPDEPNVIVDVLKPEIAPLDLWLRIAIEYYKRGKIAQFRAVLDHALDPEGAAVYGERFKNDRINILNALGGYYIQLGQAQKDAKQRDACFGAAVDKLTASGQLNESYAFTWVAKGILSLARTTPQDAQELFDTALEADRDNIPAILGKACTLYHQGHHGSSLELYRRALRTSPLCPAYVRLGIALCLFKLKEYAQARKAFERVLVLEPANVQALLGLATLELNAANASFLAADRKKQASQRTTLHISAGKSATPGATKEQQLELSKQDLADSKKEREKGEVHSELALKYLQQAYNIDPNNPMVLNRLASHFFYAADFEKSRALAHRAIENSTVPPIQAEAYYQIAKSFHVQGDYERAFQFYTTAIQRDVHHDLAQFGLAQMHLQRDQFGPAKRLLEEVHRKHPDNADVLRLLGALHGMSGEMLQAKELLEKATRNRPSDVELWLELAAACEPVNIQEAYVAYSHAVTLLKAAHKPIPAQLWNNVGVVCQLLDRTKEAKKAYEKALLLGNGSFPAHAVPDRAPAAADDSQSQGSDGHHMNGSAGASQQGGTQRTPFVIPKDNVTTIYNLALLYEKEGNTLLAQQIYKDIIAQYPDYLDAYIRMGGIERARNNVKGASRWYEQAARRNKKAVDPMCLLSTLFRDKRQFHEADGWLNRVLTVLPLDNYAELSRATLKLEEHRVEKDANRRASLLERAVQIFRHVLKRDSHNMYAANGLGVVLAERARYMDAKAAFVQIREATGDIPDVWINLAHVYVAQEQYEYAIRMYQHVIDKFYANPDPTLLLYLARAYYQKGQMQQARSVLMKAIRCSPQDGVLWYNLALANEHHGISVLQRKTFKTAAEVIHAVDSLKNAARIFKGLQLALSTPYKQPAETVDGNRGIIPPDEAAPAAAAPPAAAAAAAAAAPADDGDAKPMDVDAAGVVPAPAAATSAEEPVLAIPIDRWWSSSPETPVLLEKVQAHYKFCADSVSKGAVHIDHARRQEERAKKLKEESARAKQEVEAAIQADLEEKRLKDERERERLDLLALEDRKRAEAMTQEWQAQHEAEKKEQEDKKEASKADKAERADRARSKRNKDTDDGFLAPDDAVELDVDALRRDKAKKKGSDVSDSGSESSEESSSEESVVSGGEDAPAAKERKAAAADSSERSALRKRKESKVEKREKRKKMKLDAASTAPADGDATAAASESQTDEQKKSEEGTATAESASKPKKRRLTRPDRDTTEEPFSKDEQVQAENDMEAALFGADDDDTPAAATDDGDAAPASKSKKRRVQAIESDEDEPAPAEPSTVSGDQDSAPPAASDEVVAPVPAASEPVAMDEDVIVVGSEQGSASAPADA